MLYLQHVLGYGPLKIALALLPIGVTIFLVARFITGKLIGRAGIRAVCIGGLLIQAVGLALFGLVSLHGNYLAVFLPGLVLVGIALGTVFASVNVGGVSGNIEAQHQGVAASLIVAAYAIGTGIGAAVMATVITATTTGTGPAALLHSYRVAFLVAALIAVLGLVVSVTAMPRKKQLEQQPSEEEVIEAEAGVAAS